MTQGDDTTRPEPSADDVPSEAEAAAPAPEAAGPQPGAGDDPAGDASRELDEARTQRDEYLDALQRLKADFENFRKRNERDRVAQRDGAVRDVVLDVVPVLDNLERAVEALGQADASLVEGVDMVRQQLVSVLGARGLEHIEVVGQRFDPTEHDAVSMAPAAEPEGTIIAEVQKGYRMGDTVIRAAKVVVSSGQ